MKNETQMNRVLMAVMIGAILISVMAFVMAIATILEIAEPFSDVHLTAITEWIAGLLVLEIGPWLYVTNHVLKMERNASGYEKRLKALENKVGKDE